MPHPESCLADSHRSQVFAASPASRLATWSRVRYQANFVGQLGFEFLEPRPRFDLRNGSDTPVLYPLGAKPRLAALLRFKRGPLQFGDAHFDILILDAFDGKIKNALGGSEPDGGGHPLVRHQF
jgi:hypothetical protein